MLVVGVLAVGCEVKSSNAGSDGSTAAPDGDAGRAGDAPPSGSCSKGDASHVIVTLIRNGAPTSVIEPLAWGASHPAHAHLDGDALRDAVRDALGELPADVASHVQRVIFVEDETTIPHIDPNANSVFTGLENVGSFDLSFVPGYTPPPEPGDHFAGGYTYPTRSFMVINVFRHTQRDAQGHAVRDGSGNLVLDLAKVRGTVAHEASHMHDTITRGFQGGATHELTRPTNLPDFEAHAAGTPDVLGKWKQIIADECTADPDHDYYLGNPDKATHDAGFLATSDDAARAERGAVRAYSLSYSYEDIATTEEDVIGNHCAGVKQILASGSDAAKRTILRKLQLLRELGFICPDVLARECGDVDALLSAIAAGSTCAPAAQPGVDCASMVATFDATAAKDASAQDILALDERKHTLAADLMSKLQGGTLTIADLNACGVTVEDDRMVNTMGGPKSCCWTGWWQTSQILCAAQRRAPLATLSCTSCRFVTAAGGCGGNRSLP